ncbi:predicted protein [Nematostella vectensis]|uniref:UPAR/Ly6 domain-containing protein n=1 Tax=Nematostella vectensis TaxID=45351 RepID=A7RU85_NEMVE|nr:predicted protein [Nematostella vectensis]|eukprot:XP_001637099.1 predicted protein [Nematostella vectensis]
MTRAISTSGFIIIVALTVVLSTPAESIKCYGCLSNSTTSCHTSVIDCPGHHDACHAVHFTLSRPGFSVGIYHKQCSFLDFCPSLCQRYNQTGAVSACEVECCVTDLCNARFGPTNYAVMFDGDSSDSKFASPRWYTVALLALLARCGADLLGFLASLYGEQ